MISTFFVKKKILLDFLKTKILACGALSFFGNSNNHYIPNFIYDSSFGDFRITCVCRNTQSTQSELVSESLASNRLVAQEGRSESSPRFFCVFQYTKSFRNAIKPRLLHLLSCANERVWVIDSYYFHKIGESWGLESCARSVEKNWVLK